MITYSKLLNNMPRRIALALLLSTGSFASLLADNRLSIADITVLENRNYVISVKMENDADITAVQAMLELPQGMTVVRQWDQYAPTLQNWEKNVNFVLNNTRTYGEADKDEFGQALPRHEFNYSSQNGDTSPYDVQISHAKLMPFKGPSGSEIFHFTVHTDGSLADLDSIGLKNIKFVREDASKVRQADFYAKVTKADQEPFEPLLYFDGTEITVNPDEGQTTVEIKLRTNLDVRGVNATVKLPRGMKLGGYQAMNNSDVNKLLDMEFHATKSDETGTTYKVAMSHRLESHKVETVDGLFDDNLFAFVVSADDNLLDGSLIEFTDMDVVSNRPDASGVNEEKVSPDFVILVNNPKVAVKAREALDLVSGLQEQADALEVDPEVRNCPDEEVKGLVARADSAIAAAQDLVDALEDIVSDAIADGTVATPARQQEIADAAQAAQAAIDRAQAAIDDAEDLYDAKYGANEEANARMNLQLDELQRRLNWARDQMLGSPVQPEFVDEAAAIQDSIDSLRNYVKEQYEARKLTKESSIDDGVAAANQAIDNMLTAFHQEVDKYNENRNAYANLKPRVGQLREAMAAAEDVINALPDVAADYNDAIDGLNDRIDSLDDDLEERYANRGLTLTSTIGDKQLLAEIADLVAAAQAAQAKVDADRQKFAEDKEAMSGDAGELQDRLDDLQADLDALTDVDPDMKQDVQDMLDDIQDQIDAIVDALENARDLDDLAAVEDLIDAAGEALDNAEAALDELERSVKIGDLTGDGKVTSADVTVAVEYISTETYPTAAENPVLFKKLDANEDGVINVGDITAILNLALYGNAEGVAGSRMATAVNSELAARTTVAGGRQVIALSMDGAARFVGAQMDVVLPEGMTVASVKSATGHRVVTRQLKDGATRIMLLSQTNAAFSGDALLSIELEGSGQAGFRNVVFADAAARAYEVGVAAGAATGISGVKAAADGQSTVYSLGGRLVDTLRKGVNIIRRADGTTRKVVK
jgi:hypothetical protein